MTPTGQLRETAICVQSVLRVFRSRSQSAIVHRLPRYSDECEDRYEYEYEHDYERTILRATHRLNRCEHE